MSLLQNIVSFQKPLLLESSALLWKNTGQAILRPVKLAIDVI